MAPQLRYVRWDIPSASSAESLLSADPVPHQPKSTSKKPISFQVQQRVEGEEAGGDDGRPDHRCRWAGDKEGAARVRCGRGLASTVRSCLRTPGPSVAVTSTSAWCCVQLYSTSATSGSGGGSRRTTAACGADPAAAASRSLCSRASRS